MHQRKKRREQENNSEKENQSSLVWNKCGGNKEMSSIALNGELRIKGSK